MGGEGSGRKPDPIKAFMTQHTQPINPQVCNAMIVPNFSGLKKGMKKTDDEAYLKLDQTTPQTMTDSPIWTNLTATRIPFVDTDKSLTDASSLTFTNVTTGGGVSKLLSINTGGTDQYGGSTSVGQFTITGINGFQDGGNGSLVVIGSGAGNNGTVSGPVVSKGGPIDFNTGNGGNITKSTAGGTVTGGNAGNLGCNLTAGSGTGGNAIASGSGTSGVGGAGASRVFGSDRSCNGGEATTTTSGNNTGGAGGNCSFFAGGGGDASGGTINTAGNMGTMNFAGAGNPNQGKATSAVGTTAISGNGVTMNFTCGNGRPCTGGGTNTGGAGGAPTFTAGNGGAATGGTSNTGGAGGTVTFQAGVGGAGATAAGANGNIIFKSSTTEIARFDNTAGAVGNFRLTLDNQKIQLGTAQDTAEYYDGTDLIINPQVVGTGDLKILGGSVNSVGGFKANGTAGISATITTAAITPGGATGSMTFVKGILTAQTQAT